MDTKEQPYDYNNNNNIITFAIKRYSNSQIHHQQQKQRVQLQQQQQQKKQKQHRQNNICQSSESIIYIIPFSLTEEQVAEAASATAKHTTITSTATGIVANKIGFTEAACDDIIIPIKSSTKRTPTKPTSTLLKRTPFYYHIQHLSDDVIIDKNNYCYTERKRETVNHQETP